MSLAVPDPTRINGVQRWERIDDIRLLEFTAPAPVWTGLANSTCMGSPVRDFVPAARPARPQAGGTAAIAAQYVEVVSNRGNRGIFGPIRPAISQEILFSLRSILAGRRVFEREDNFSELLAPRQHPRPGIYVSAFGAVECALWDLRGKLLGQPVYALLGMPVRCFVRCYASLLGYDPDAEDAEELALGVRQAGFSGQKWALREGPQEGESGLARNVARVRRLRRIVGAKHSLMFDALGKWNSAYALQFLRAIQPYKIAFLEEPVHPEDKAGFRELAKGRLAPIAGGEHLYTHCAANRYLSSGLLDVIQPDVAWCGGLAEAIRITRLAAGRKIPVLPHGAALIPALHLAACCSQAALPLVEYHMTVEPKRQYFLCHKYQPAGDEIRLAPIPGLGITLDPLFAKSGVLDNPCAQENNSANTHARQNAITAAGYSSNKAGALCV